MVNCHRESWNTLLPVAGAQNQGCESILGNALGSQGETDATRGLMQPLQQNREKGFINCFQRQHYYSFSAFIPFYLRVHIDMSILFTK